MRKAALVIAILFVSLAAISARGTATATDLSALAWMAGTWTGTQDGVEMEELWMAPKGNSMLALHRDVKDGRTIDFEFLRIEATPEGITYWASPRAKPPTPFRMVELKDKRVVFENAEHAFPRRIIYWLTDDGALHAKIEGTLNGQPAAEEWAWKKAAG
jgi:hypothetical protein